MTDSTQIKFEAILDVENENYIIELVALFKSCGINPIIAVKEQTIEEIKKLSLSGCKETMFVTDHINENKLREHELIPSIKIESVLLVDDESKDKIIDNEGLMLFGHVLSCNQEHVPHLQLMSTIRKIREKNILV